MKRFISSLVVLALACSTLFAQMADPNAPLQNDPSVRMGKLANGMTYYIQHNAKPEQRAEFYLATHVGAIQENEHQDGLAHFLEHMALNGTKNLPGKMLINYLESIGCSFGGNINAGTGVEMTTYMLNNIPMLREGVLDTCLLILHDYAAFVSNEPQEIDNERGVIVEELRMITNAQWRVRTQLYKYLFKDSKYATCSLIGTIDGLQHFEHHHLVDFYTTWYRPDLQALIIVGDVDPDQVEAKLQTLFADIPAPATPNPKKPIYVPENDDPIVGIITDPEQTSSSIMYVIKSDPVPTEMRNYGAIYLTDMIKSLLTSMMDDRLSEVARQSEPPFMEGGFGFGQLAATVDATLMSVQFKDGEALPAFEAFMMEIEKAKRFGFTESEVERAKTNLVRRLERAAQNAGDRQNAQLVNPIMNHFFYNDPVLDPVYELQVANGYLPFLTAEVVNSVLPQLFTEENQVIAYMAPQREGLSHPTEDALLEVLDKVADAELEAYQEEVLDEPLVDESTLTPGKVVATSEGIYQSTVWTLSNGAQVVVLPTPHKQDEVLFGAWQDGGVSIVPEELINSLEDNVFGLWVNYSGVGNYSATNLKKKLTGVIAHVSPTLGSYDHGLTGSCSPQDIETMLQLAYAHWVTPRFVASEFEPGLAQLKAILPNMGTNPMFRFQQELTKSLFNNHPRRIMLSMEQLEKVNVAHIEQAYKTLFKGVDGTTFVLVGNVNLETLKPLVEKYLGGLPSTGVAPKWVDDGANLATGINTNHIEMNMEVPKTTVSRIYTGQLPLTMESMVQMENFSALMDIAYTKSLREDEGGTYAPQTLQQMMVKPSPQAFFLLYFDTNPNEESLTRMLDIAKADLDDMAQNGPTQENLNKTKENFLKNYQELQIQNAYWKESIAMYYKTGIDRVAEYPKAVEALTTDSVKQFVSRFLGQGNRIEILINPVTK